MRARTISPEDLDASLLAKWRGFQAADATLASPFLAPEVAAGFGRHIPRARIGIVEDGNRVVGFLPHEAHPLGIVKALGHGYTDCQGMIAKPGVAWDNFDLLGAFGFSTFEFDHLIAGQANNFGSATLEPTTSSVIDLAAGIDRWVESKRKLHHFKELMRRSRKLERNFGIPRFEPDSRNPAELETLIAWKSAQYRRTGRIDPFAAGPFGNIVRDLFERGTDGFSTRLSTLYVDERPVSLSLTLTANGTTAEWLRAFDRDFSGYSPGLIHIRHMMDDAIAHNVRYLDFGAGNQDYKVFFANATISLAKGMAHRPTAMALVRRAQTAPLRVIEPFVLARPRLRKAVRETLAWIGQFRSSTPLWLAYLSVV